MRRLLASVAALAIGLLVAPSAALATDNPVLGQPTSPTNAATIGLAWNDVRAPMSSATYEVWRAPKDCSIAIPGDFVHLVAADQTDAFSYDDPRPPDGTYCYFVRADNGTGPADSNQVAVTIDTAPPVITLTPTGGNGCVPFTVSATATDPSAVTIFTADGAPYNGTTLTPAGPEFLPVSVVFAATDGIGNATLSPFVVASGQVQDLTRPPTPVLELATDPVAQKVTLSWEFVTSDGAPVSGYRVRTKGPTGSPDIPVENTVHSLVFNGLQVDATYEYTLVATDACGESGPSIRLVRLNDTTPPSKPIVASPAFIASSHAITLSWIPSTDNIQVDHYQILRNGVPLGVTDTSVFTDPSPGQHAALSYVVRAVDTNGNETDSDPATFTTPDWTPPTAPVPTVTALGRTVTLSWPAAGDNVGVVGYDVLRDGKIVRSMTAAVRTAKDFKVPVGRHTWVVRARDDAGNATDSLPKALNVKKLFAHATVVAVRMAGSTHGGAARYTVAGPARLLLDVRVVGTLSKAKLRLYVQSGSGRITVWRGTPGSSSTRERLHSTLVRRGFVTIALGRSLHAGRTRLVLIAGSRVVIAASGKHKPTLRAG